MREKVRKIKTLSHFILTAIIFNWTIGIISYCCHMAIQWANQIMFYPEMLTLTTKAWEKRIRQVNFENKLNGLFIQVLSGICLRQFSLHISNFHSQGSAWNSEKSFINQLIFLIAAALGQVRNFSSISWRRQVTFSWADDICLAEEQQIELKFYRANSLNQWSTGTHVTALRQIILTPSQLVFALIP